MIEDDDLSRNCNIIWNKTSTDAKIEVNSKPVYNEILLKTQAKFYGDEATDLFDKEVLKIDSIHTCLTKIPLDSIFEVDENYYLQVFFKRMQVN